MRGKARGRRLVSFPAPACTARAATQRSVCTDASRVHCCASRLQPPAAAVAASAAAAAQLCSQHAALSGHTRGRTVPAPATRRSAWPPTSTDWLGTTRTQASAITGPVTARAAGRDTAAPLKAVLPERSAGVKPAAPHTQKPLASIPCGLGSTHQWTHARGRTLLLLLRRCARLSRPCGGATHRRRCGVQMASQRPESAATPDSQRSVPVPPRNAEHGFAASHVTASANAQTAARRREQVSVLSTAIASAQLPLRRRCALCEHDQ